MKFARAGAILFFRRKFCNLVQNFASILFVLRSCVPVEMSFERARQARHFAIKKSDFDKKHRKIQHFEVKVSPFIKYAFSCL